MKKLFTIYAIKFLIYSTLLLLYITPVDATDYYVSPHGNDLNLGTSVDYPWMSPSYAATMADAGDTVFLINGTWIDEHVVFSNSGNATHPIIVTAYNGTPTFDGLTGSGHGFVAINKDFRKK